MTKENKEIAAELTAKILAGSFISDNYITVKDKAEKVSVAFSILFEKILEELDSH